MTAVIPLHLKEMERGRKERKKGGTSAKGTRKKIIKKPTKPSKFGVQVSCVQMIASKKHLRFEARYKAKRVYQDAGVKRYSHVQVRS